MEKFIVCPKCNEENHCCDLCKGLGKVDIHSADFYFFKQSLISYNPYYQSTIKKIDQRTKYL